jgi:hypothetical protein
VQRVALASAELLWVAQPGRPPMVRRSGGVFEAPAFVAGLDDVAVVSEAVGVSGSSVHRQESRAFF